MKKLLVLALSVVMVLAFAAVSMAAVAVSGEVNFTFNVAGPESAPGVDFVASDAGQGDAKVAFTATLNDEVSAFVALKNSGVDETWAKFTEGFGSVKVGYFGWNIKDNIDIFNNVGDDLKSDAGIAVDATIAEGITFSGMIARPDDQMDMGIKVAYNADAFGVSVGYKKWDDKHVTAAGAFDPKDAVIAVNGKYNLAPVVIYLTYATAGSDFTDGILGVSYDSDSIYARAEVEVIQPDNVKTDAANGFRVGYKLGNGAKLELNSSSLHGEDAATSIKLNVAF